MVKRTLFLVGIAALLFGLLFSGCAKESAQQAASAEKDAYLTVKDDAGRTVTLERRPERIVVLSPSFLEPLGALQAPLIGRPSSKSEIPEFAEELAEIGNVNNINIEQVVALKPDLVIAYQGRHDKFVPLLANSKIPVIVVHMKTYEEVREKVRLFAKIVGAQEKGEQLVQSMDARIQDVVAALPAEKPRVAVLFSTAKSVTVQLDGSIAGNTAMLLGFENVADNEENARKDAVPYSMESLVAQNPEIIFVVTMGKLEDIKARMQADVENSPAWSTLEAVRNQKVYFLPQELFLLNPGLRYPEAAGAMAKTAYPERFHHEK